MRSLIFGEDFTSDPVSKALGLGLRAFSRGQIQVDVAQLSQVSSALMQAALSIPIDCLWLLVLRGLAKHLQWLLGLRRFGAHCDVPFHAASLQDLPVAAYLDNCYCVGWA